MEPTRKQKATKEKENTTMKNASARAGRPIAPMNDEELEYRLVGRGYMAKGRRTADGFVVYAGAKFGNPTTTFLKCKGFVNRFSQLMSDGTVVGGILTKDYIFNSHAMAACIVAGSIINGLTAWRDASDNYAEAVTYGELHGMARSAKAERNPHKRSLPVPAADKAVMESDSLIDGKAWHNEWRGRTPIHSGGIYLGVRCV